ncbi:hypothetical protein EXIGLDRAFT_760591 [Exidia glandulosa HHB12029]|uniref:Uncharacterized protein n=1 Tax=Exidia glandulosa HHB12029 TaxID=1314781 RepID=A0A165P5K9_EXIGL|nr:hypothetical protein EXIGLDRAFT_760591 [Exidia glandulosa HHB12029]
MHEVGIRLGRLLSLEITIGQLSDAADDRVKHLLLLLCRPAPVLRSFRLRGVEFFPYQPLTLHIPHDVFAGAAPDLTRIILDGQFCLPSQWPFPAATEVQLCKEEIKVVDIVRVIASSPKLRRLRLSSLLNVAPSYATVPTHGLTHLQLRTRNDLDVLSLLHHTAIHNIDVIFFHGAFNFLLESRQSSTFDKLLVRRSRWGGDPSDTYWISSSAADVIKISCVPPDVALPQAFVHLVEIVIDEARLREGAQFPPLTRLRVLTIAYGPSRRRIGPPTMQAKLECPSLRILRLAIPREHWDVETPLFLHEVEAFDVVGIVHAVLGDLVTKLATLGFNGIRLVFSSTAALKRLVDIADDIEIERGVITWPDPDRVFAIVDHRFVKLPYISRPS